MPDKNKVIGWLGNRLREFQYVNEEYEMLSDALELIEGGKRIPILYDFDFEEICGNCGYKISGRKCIRCPNCLERLAEVEKDG